MKHSGVTYQMGQICMIDLDKTLEQQHPSDVSISEPPSVPGFVFILRDPTPPAEERAARAGSPGTRTRRALWPVRDHTCAREYSPAPLIPGARVGRRLRRRRLSPRLPRGLGIRLSAAAQAAVAFAGKRCSEVTRAPGFGRAASPWSSARGWSFAGPLTPAACVAVLFLLFPARYPSDTRDPRLCHTTRRPAAPEPAATVSAAAAAAGREIVTAMVRAAPARALGAASASASAPSSPPRPRSFCRKSSQREAAHGLERE
ncbi:hypothetical protein TREES_T100006472 [Tupaia chinensis]|uniref:Uncharacterized protein n=1 Tax=Tupaia chinensis TaxID=246437 RepID=L9KV42_TUPCH|nr:hypothetical protein TREES_T100006472 [Tupaia chinensis]